MGLKTHMMSNTKIYQVWHTMKRRCTQEKRKDYKHYGGRGITVCDIWLSFENFYEWAIRHGYSEGLELDRIDVNGNYCPENCRFVTRIENIQNRTMTVKTTINGITKPITEWAVIHGISKTTIRSRYNNGDRGEFLIRPAVHWKGGSRKCVESQNL